ncbi:serine/threonine protein kinase [Labilithrix luteola]|uniref:Serine/threonine protein kinase n=1 Tax=Labilithrix luteola TaxID=1391654 RepID=A0A0K1PT33_9BACT|nr:serine/threonine-protein kinase [Labilithrix luteola]AKU96274.1 serine/threonine protein kinase [Labilithrix luteola]
MDRPSKAPPANNARYGGGDDRTPATSSVPPALRAGLVIADKYELVCKLGTGSMGEVWSARHASLDELVAIKLVMRDHDHQDGSSASARFLVEARCAAALSRKTRHVVSVTDHGDDPPLAYLVMELLAGPSLDSYLEAQGTLSVERAAEFVSQLARGIDVAHEDGIVHRDLKPSNVVVAADEEGEYLLKILDFGIAKVQRQRRSPNATQRGVVIGTPAFMSPEQSRGQPDIDHRADVWALAVIAYVMLTGELPFDGESAEDIMLRLSLVDPIPVHARRADLPPRFADFFARAFDVRLERRFSSAGELAEAFCDVANGVESPSFLRSKGDEETAIEAAGVPPSFTRPALLLGGFALLLAATAFFVTMRWAAAEERKAAALVMPPGPLATSESLAPPSFELPVADADLPPHHRVTSVASAKSAHQEPSVPIVLPAPVSSPRAVRGDKSDIF